MSDTARPTALETVTCSRCGGCGRYSYCTMYGDRCFKCHGAGRVYTKRGAAAKAFYEALLSKPVGEIVPGMKIRVNISMLGTKLVWATVTSAGWSETAKYGRGEDLKPYYEIKYDANGKAGTLNVFNNGTEMMRVAATAEEKHAAMEKAIDYMLTLTKTGTVRKSAAKTEVA